MKDKIMNAITDVELNEIGTEISVRNLDNQSELFNLISERRKQLNDVRRNDFKRRCGGCGV